MSDINVSFFDAIGEYGGQAFHAKRVICSLCAAACMTSVVCAVILVDITTGWDPQYFSFDTSNKYFYHYTADSLYISIAQCVVLPLIAWGGVASASSEARPPIENKCCECFRCFYSTDKGRLSSRTSSFDSQADSEGGQPLLEQDTLNPPPTNLEGYEFENAIKQANSAGEEHAEGSPSKKQLDYKKSAWLAALFLVSTLIQVYVGLKCISFNYTRETEEGALMGLEVLWVNIIAWLLRELVQRATKDEGELCPNLHPHRLHLHTALAAHWCDLCGQQCKDGRAYRCKLCDFDLCIICYAKKDTFTLEGQLRGDKGIRRDEATSGDKYFMRALMLVRSEWQIFAVGLLCLCVYNGISLAMPTVQGSILNAVVAQNHSQFMLWIKWYLLSAVVLGIFGGIQSLCFNIAGRKISNLVRTKLFKGIVTQDIAFFDGNSSGQLTSRLTNDVSFMVSPIQSMLSRVLSNSILLVGGIALCFYTSWRLSILAFATIGPIIHVTQVYATWSQWLNRRIYASLAAANGYATEALGNIRTVKAFTTEKYEQYKYDEANDSALSKGIQDAFGGAGMYAINSYLELGASVLILWYGGMMAMDDKQRMTPGRLITYQLYWNMLNTSYKSLLDIVTQFTRAAGAAQRVFSLMDSMPDIDISAGRSVPPGLLQGEIELRNVSFAYQMRPNALVLSDVSIRIPAGTTCALVGKSGGGKSTFVNLLMRFYDPKSGSVLLDRSDLKELCLQDVRRDIGIVQQNTELFGGTIEENITYGMPDGSWNRHDVIDAAKKACAHDFIKAFPEGYLTRVGERGVRISGGQKQRIAIARVFLRDPKILLLDEATSALDAESEAKVQEALDTLMDTSTGKRRTIILVAHRLSTVINADQIAVISGGQISELGNHESLLAKRGEYFKLVQRQLKKKNSIVDADNVSEEGEDES